MKKNWTKPLLISASLFIFNFACAQQSVNSSGGDANGNGGTAAYSVGQVVYTTPSGNGGSTAQGVQQAFEISTVAVMETDLNISLKAFPNPTTENLTLQIGLTNYSSLSYSLYDLNGKLLKNELINSMETHINMNTFPSSVYFLNVTDTDNKKIQTFKIIKN